MITVRCLNTPACWEIRAPFSVLPALRNLSPYFYRFREFKRQGGAFFVESGSVRQPVRQPGLTFEVGEAIFFMPHSLIKAIHDQNGLVWENGEYKKAPI